MAEATKHKHSRGLSKKAHVENHCAVEGCKNPYRAKGYCSTHYKAWRDGEFGKIRYKICGKEDCKKRVFQRGICETHFNEWKASKSKAAKPGAAAPAAG